MTERAESKTFHLSKRLSVDINVGTRGIVCEWIPDMPVKLTEAELRAYRVARDEMLARLARRIGGCVACVEV